MLANKLLGAGGADPAAAAPVYVEDVFSTYLYTGSGAFRSIDNNIALGTAYGGRMVFDGTGDNETIADNAAIELPTQDFTIECFVFRSSSSSEQVLVQKGLTTSSNFEYSLRFDASNLLKFYWSENGSTTSSLTATTGALATGSWAHCVVTRSGSNLALWMDGVNVGSTSSFPATIYAGAGALSIGATSGNTLNFSGNISNLRITKGRRVYTSSFTPPSDILGTTTGGQNPPTGTEVSLLTCRYPDPAFDYSSNSFAITVTNALTVAGGGPFTDSRAGKGGLVWIKSRSAATGNFLYDTERGANQELNSNTTDASTNLSNSVQAFFSNAFAVSSAADVNTLNATYASWTFRKQAKFFDVVTYTGNGASNRQISHSLRSTPGCIIIKETSQSGAWYVYHTSNGTGKYLTLNTTNASTTSADYFPAVSSTTFTPSANTFLNTNGVSYVAYLFAHDAGGFGAAGTDNVISCGSYTGNGSATGPTITLGYEPQWVMIKSASSAADGWAIFDTMRGLGGASGVNNQLLYANTSGAESGGSLINVTPTGFQANSTFGTVNNSGVTYIYIAIRRPMKTPTSGTSVFSAVTRAGTGVAATIASGFTADMIWTGPRATTTVARLSVTDRLRNGAFSYTEATNAEAAAGASNFGTSPFDQMDGVDIGTTSSATNSTSYNYLNWIFRRASNFLDIVCDTGTGSARTVPHNLGVVPELIIRKSRSTTGSWAVYAKPLGANNYLLSNSTAAQVASATYWNGAEPTNSVFSVGTATNTNGSTVTYVSYLFATCPGVSKVSSYIGKGVGTVNQVDCGFTAGARAILIKRVDAVADWYMWDTTRGIIAGNDPYLLFNTGATAEVTNTDYIDPYSGGFEISATAPAALNEAPGITWVNRTSNFGTAGIQDVVYGNGLYVAVGTSGTLATSPDGITWTTRTSSFGSSTIWGVDYGNSKFVAVGNAGTLATSSDGITWTQQTSNFGTNNINAVAFGNGLFVAVGATGTLATSTDGITWTTRTSQFGASNINAVVYGNGQFVAVGVSGKVSTSSDGITWTAQTSGVTTVLNEVTYGNGLFVVVGDSGVLRTSSDGVTWTSRTHGFGTGGITAAGFGNGVFVVGGSGGTLQSSTDGITWTTRSSGFGTNQINNFGFGNNMLIAVGASATLTTNKPEYLYLAIA